MDAEESAPFEVFAENWETVRVFLALQTQWRVLVGMSAIVYQGLEYASLPPILELYGVEREKWPELFTGLRLMEATAIGELNKRSNP